MTKDTSPKYDLVIVGAGPAGLAAALYAAREGIHALVLEKGVVGGMAALTNVIDNYPGFDQGVGGLELADHLLDHAVRFGAEVKTGVTVTGLKETTSGVTVKTDQGPIDASSALITTGSTYEKLHIPGETEYTGRGVHYCATCDAPLYRGREVLVVGGGNSALQETLFIAKFAAHVTVLVRGASLGGSKVLREQAWMLPNVTFRFNTAVKSIRGDGSKVTGVETNPNAAGATDIRADAVFVFVGLMANTQVFRYALDLDDAGFIKTSPNYATSMPGVYAAGDVRSGSTWQIASAIGEGVSAAITIRTRLEKQRHAALKSAKTTSPKAAAKSKSGVVSKAKTKKPTAV